MSDYAGLKTKTIKVPGPDHPITIERNAHHIVVTVAGRVVADTQDALTLREASYAPVQYIPRKDVDLTLLERADHTTYCTTRATALTLAFPPAEDVPSTLSGLTKHLTLRLPRSRITLLFIPNASTRSRSARAVRRFERSLRPRCRPLVQIIPGAQYGSDYGIATHSALAIVRACGCEVNALGSLAREASS